MHAPTSPAQPHSKAALRVELAAAGVATSTTGLSHVQAAWRGESILGCNNIPFILSLVINVLQPITMGTCEAFATQSASFPFIKPGRVENHEVCERQREVPSWNPIRLYCTKLHWVFCALICDCWLYSCVPHSSYSGAGMQCVLLALGCQYWAFRYSFVIWGL